MWLLDDGKVICHDCHEVGGNDITESSDESVSSGLDSNGSSSGPEVDRAEESIAFENSASGVDQSNDDASVFVQHVRFKTLHLMGLDSESSLACGRFCGDRYRVLLAVPKFDWPRCRSCFPP